MQVRFQADADLNQNIVLAALRRLSSIDFQSATIAGVRGLADPEVLRLAAADGRILVSHDQRTMPRHFAQFIVGGESPGLLIVPQSMSVAAAAEDLVLIATVTTPSEWINRVAYLPI